MKKLLCLAVYLLVLTCTACAENKSFGSRLYDVAVKGTATVKKTVNKIKESESFIILRKELEETFEKPRKSGNRLTAKKQRKNMKQ